MEHPSKPTAPNSHFESNHYPGFPPLSYPAEARPPASSSAVLRVGLPLFSLVASIVVYAWIFSWELSLGIIALLFVHEIGHYIVIRAKGLPASLPVFIPLVGAYVAMRRMPASVRDEAEIAIAGPAVGALSGIACYLLYQWTQEPSLLLLARLAFLLNLINLIPIAPLDGGRIVGAISRWIWVLGLILIAVGFFYTNDPVIRLVLLGLGWLGFIQLRGRFRGGGLSASYYRISLPLRAYITLLYLGLIVSLVLGFLASEQTTGSMPVFHLSLSSLVH
jgi:Zn-dependent protease